MGYGLVAIPRQLWRIANVKGAEKASFHKAGLQADRAIAAKKCATGKQGLDPAMKLCLCILASCSVLASALSQSASQMIFSHCCHVWQPARQSSQPFFCCDAGRWRGWPRW